MTYKAFGLLDGVTRFLSSASDHLGPFRQQESLQACGRMGSGLFTLTRPVEGNCMRGRVNCQKLLNVYNQQWQSLRAYCVPGCWQQWVMSRQRKVASIKCCSSREEMVYKHLMLGRKELTLGEAEDAGERGQTAGHGSGQ